MINKLFENLSPSGAEDKTREFLINTLEKKFDTVTVDNIGNLIFHKSGSGKKLCIECGMDSRGIMIVSSENGKAHFAAVGQLDASYLADKKIQMTKGGWGIVRYEGADLSAAKTSDLYLEMDTEGLEIGDFGIVCPQLCDNDSSFYANGLSDVLGAAAVVSALTGAEINCDLTVIFSAQKALGGRGLRAFFGESSFDIVLTVNCCKGKEDNGCAIAAKDKGAVADPMLRKELEEMARANSIKAQTIVSDENLFIGGIAHSGSGNACGCLCIPTSHKGKTLEGASKKDFEAIVELIIKIVGDN